MAIALVLLLATIADVGAIMFGGLFTADSYYLPLRNINVGESRDALEKAIINVHTVVLARKHSILLVIHTLALALTLFVFGRLKWASKHPVA